MAISKQTIFDALTIRSDGNVEIRMATIVLDDDGSELGRRFHRRVIGPQDDISGEPQKIQRICQIARS